TPGLAHRLRHLGEESRTQGGQPLAHDEEQDEAERHQGQDDRGRAEDLHRPGGGAPAQVVGGRLHAAAATGAAAEGATATGLSATRHRRSRDSALTTMVMRKSTNPISTRAWR